MPKMTPNIDRVLTEGREVDEIILTKDAALRRDCAMAIVRDVLGTCEQPRPGIDTEESHAIREALDRVFTAKEIWAMSERAKRIVQLIRHVEQADELSREAARLTDEHAKYRDRSREKLNEKSRAMWEARREYDASRTSGKELATMKREHSELYAMVAEQLNQAAEQPA